MGLCAGSADHADLQSVEEEQIESSNSAQEAAGEDQEGNADIVGQDGTGRLRFGAEYALRPHLMPLDGADHMRAEKLVHELWPGRGEEYPEHASGKGDSERRERVKKQPAEEAWVVAGQKTQHRPKTELAAGINVIVGPAKKLIEVRFQCAGCPISASGGEVRSSLAVQYTEFAQLRAG